MLNKIIHGDATDRPSLVIAHGLFGSARNWGVIAKRMSEDRQVTAVDMRNHGDSPREATNSYLDMADDLANVLQTGDDVLGHSMGGKAVMTLALQHPNRLRRIIIADIAPVTYTHSQQPMIDAMRQIDLTTIESRRDADEQLMPHVPEAGVRAFLLQSLDVQARRWKLNLDVLQAEMDNIIGFPDLGGRFDGPALFLSGADSDYVEREHRPRIKALFPKARFAKIPGAGHWLHAEKPREFEAAITAFLDNS
ncbi:alpha/beta fold hydrolase [Rhodobacteraceae bacterium]|nr:alpha/beta fold hydrolase [Paracoccaceae bacterium]